MSLKAELKNLGWSGFYQVCKHSAPDARRRKRKKRPKARQKSFRNYFGHFFAQVSNKVTRGHERSKYAIYGYFSWRRRLSPELWQLGRNRKKHAIALWTLFLQRVLRFELGSIVFAPGVIKCQNDRFWRKWFFADIFLTKSGRAIILAPSCFSRRDASKHIHGDLERSRSKFDLRSRSLRSTYWPEWVMLHISRCALMRQTHWYHFARLYLHPIDSYRQKVLVTSDDVIWRHMTLIGGAYKKCFSILRNSLRYHHPEGVEAIWHESSK